MSEHEFESSLRSALHHDADGVWMAGPGPQAAQARSLRRHRQRRTAAGVMGATVMAAAAFTAFQSSPAPKTKVAADDSTPAGVRPAAAPPLSLSFRLVDGTVLFDNAHFVTEDGVLYALSTAPGAPKSDGPSPQAIYRTTDGVTWDRADLGAAPWIAGLSEHGGVLYAVGTAPGSSSGSTAVTFGTSSNDGKTWAKSTVPVGLAKPAASVPVTGGTQVQIARGAHETVVMATANYDLTISNSGDGMTSWRRVADGYDQVDYAKCKANLEGASPEALAAAKAARTSTDNCAEKVDHKSWAELGVSHPEDLIQHELAVQADGGQWQTIASPVTDDQYAAQITATDDGYLIVAGSKADGNAGAVVYRSVDGRTWTTAVGAPADLSGVAAHGDSLIGMSSSTSNVYVSNDGAQTWTAVDLASFLPAGTGSSGLGNVDVGPLGFAALVTIDSSGDTVTPFLMISSDGVTWSTTKLSDVGGPAKGYAGQVTVGADHIAVTYAGSARDAKNQIVSQSLVGTPRR